jgi:hypothetical protein
LNTEAIENKLQELGLYKEAVSGAMTEVFIRLKFRPPSDIIPLPENPNPGDTSLDLFIDCEIELTPFDTDCITVSEFRQRYEHFIDKHSDLVEVPITPRVMLRFSSELVRKKLTFYLAIHGETDTTAEVTASRVHMYMVKPLYAALYFLAWGPHMTVLFTVLVHMLSTLLIPFPIFYVTVLSQHEVAKYELPGVDVFSKEEILEGPEPNTFNYNLGAATGLEWQNGLTIAMTAAFYVLGFIELIQFYIFETGVEDKVIKEHKNVVSVMIRNVYIALIRAPFHVLAVLFVVMTLSYVGLVLVWALLGAVVNPYKYLPYAAAAGTLVFATAFRYDQLASTRMTANKRIHFQIAKRLERLLEARTRGYGTGQNVGDGDADPTQNEDGERFLDRRSKGEFFKLVESTGLDRSSVDIYGLAHGKSTAVNTIAAQLGVEPTITMIIVSLARKNADQLLDAAQELGPKLGLDGSLARSLMNLANSWSKESGRQGIKLFINTVTGAADRDVFFNLDPATGPFHSKKDPTIDLTMGIMPELAASMLAITEDNDFEPLVELLNTEKVVRDAFKPVPQQIFAMMQRVFEHDRSGVRRSLIRMIERLLISDSCTLQMSATGKPIPISKFVEHLSRKLGTECQFASVLSKLAVLQMDTGGATGLGPRQTRAAGTANLGPKDKQMIKAMKGHWKPKDRSLIKRPVMSTKNWLRSKIVAENGTLIVGSDGQMGPDTTKFVLVYQMVCLIDGLASIVMQDADDLATCAHFCNEVLSLDPEIAGAMLALINAEEGGVNPASDQTKSMRDRILKPLARQISIDAGSKSIDKNNEKGTATAPDLMDHQIQQALAACFSLTRGRRLDFTQLAILSGLSGEVAQYIGPFLNGKMKAPLWKQVTPLCNTLGMNDSSVILALMQMRRQADNNDFKLGTDALLPWLGTPPELMGMFRWIIQFAIAARPAHIQRSMISVFGFERSPESRAFSFVISRRRRLHVPGEGMWYTSESEETCDPRDQALIRDELEGSELTPMNEWIAKESGMDYLEEPDAMWFVTRHFEHEGVVDDIDTGTAKEKFYQFVNEVHNDPDSRVDETLTGKVFDFITFFLQFGEDTSSLKATAINFKVKVDLLKALVQLPMYDIDTPVRTLRRPRAQQRTERAIELLKDHLHVPAEIAFKYNEVLGRAQSDVAANDEALFDLCVQIDRFKEVHEPRSWEYVQALTLPANEAYPGFTSRALYAILNLEKDVEDPVRYLQNVKLTPDSAKSARDRKWKLARQALRGILGMAAYNMAQVIAFLHAAAWIEPQKGHGLMLKLAVSTISGSGSNLVEQLSLVSNDRTTNLTVYNLTDALTRDLDLNKRRRDGYAICFEAIAVLTIFRRSGDPQGVLRKKFSKALRMTAECLEIHPAMITAMLSASTGDGATFDVALLQLAQDEGGLSPAVAGGLCSIGSGDVKGIEELAELIDIDPGVCEGLVALASGTPTTTRGCLPGLLASLEIDVDLGVGVLGLVNDDATSIAFLADAMTQDRPQMREAVLNTLVCLPGLRSNNGKRILAALDGIQSNSKLNIRNQLETADATLLINTNTYAVRDAFGMLKLDLDLACLAASLFKFSAVPFATCTEAFEMPAFSWRDQMPGDLDSSPGNEQLGAELLFHSLCSGRLPELFQRIAKPLGMVDTLPVSKIREENEKTAPQHLARPWNLRQSGHFLTAIFYTGVTGRFARLMEVLDLTFDRKSALQDLFELPGGYPQLIDKFSPTEFVEMLDPSAETRDKTLKRGSTLKRDPLTIIVKDVLNAVMSIPPQLHSPNTHPLKSKAWETYNELQRYLRDRLTFNAKKTLKAMMMTYALGALSMSPPPIVSRHSSKKQVALTLRWAKFDTLSSKYRVERPSSGASQTQTFMSNVDWDRCVNSDTVQQWEAYYLLVSQFTATVLSTFDDPRSSVDFEIVGDLQGGEGEDKFTQSIRFRHDTTQKSKGDESDNREVPLGAVERRQFEVELVQIGKQSLEGTGEKSTNKKRAKARESRLVRVHRILEVADDITASAINSYGEDVGGMIFGLLWNDHEKMGHNDQMHKAFQLLHLPASSGGILVAMTGRERSHPLLLPRFESVFFPATASLPPGNLDYRTEGDGTHGENVGRPPRIKTDAAGVPAFKTRVPGGIGAFFKELRIPAQHGQREALYHLLRVAMGDRAFLGLNKLSVSTKLNVPETICYGLCAGAYLQGADPYSRPDMTRIVRSLERLSADLGINENLAGLIVSAAAKNVDALRSLGIVLATGQQPGQRRQTTDLALVSKEGLVRALIGLITGEVAGELMTPCRISGDGQRWNTNIDMFCNKLLSNVFDQGDELRNHANHLRCMAGLGLANTPLLLSRRTPLFEGASLYRLLPIDPNSGEEEGGTLYDGTDSRKGDKSREKSIIEKFERSIMYSEQKAPRKYRAFFEGFLQLRLRPDALHKLVRNGQSKILQGESWLSYVVGSELWDGEDDPETRSMMSAKGNADLDSSLAARGPFSFLIFQIIKSFAGNSVGAMKRHGLVPLMEYLRPDGLSVKTVTIDGFPETVSKHTLTTMNILPLDSSIMHGAQFRTLKLWGLGSRLLPPATPLA